MHVDAPDSVATADLERSGMPPLEPELQARFESLQPSYENLRFTSDMLPGEPARGLSDAHRGDVRASCSGRSCRLALFPA